MSIGSRIKEARLAANLTQGELATKIHITKSAIANYENSISIPKPELLFKLINILNVDANYLMQDEVNMHFNFQLTFDEQNLIKKYRLLDDYDKTIVDNSIETGYKRYLENSKNNIINFSKIKEDEEDYIDNIKYIDIDTYSNGASAGSGQPLFDDMYISITSIPDTPLNRKVDFILKVHGDSMEPKFYDGDKVLVEKTDFVDVGEVGIFIVNGESYIKKRGVNSLISLNKKHKNVDIKEFDDFRTVGKVIGKL